MIGQCAVELLEAALAGYLPANEEAWLQRHVEECEACRAKLEQMAGGDVGRQEAASMLVSDELDDALSVREGWSEVDFTVEHLEPSDEPNVLGRLGGYDVLEIIGRGGMGVVLKAFDRELKRCVAIKVLAPHLAHNSLAKKRFSREAQAAAVIVHPNVLAIHQVQPHAPLPFLVMPLIAGESLAQRLATQGRLELKEILRIGMQAAAGLAAAHDQGLVHRDVKPANILLEMGVERAVLTDFGLARAADDVSMTRWGIIAGTPQYMSPEQAKGEPLDARSDLFSLGCVLYEMATGVSPFRAESTLATMRRLVEEPHPALASLNPELPPWFVVIVDKLLEKEPVHRFGSAKEVSDLLEGCLAHLQQPASVSMPAALPQPVPRPVSGWRKFRFIGVIIMLGILAIGLLAWVIQPSPEPPNIAGQWNGEGWGNVVLTKSGDKEYTGTYSDTLGKNPGEIYLKWSKVENRFSGTWREGEDRFGEISVRLVKNEIRGATTTDAKSKINPGTPRLADLTWVKGKAATIPKPPPAPKTPLLDPADAKKRAEIPQSLLQMAGGGIAARAPKTLVWVFSADKTGKSAGPAATGLAISPDGRWLAVYKGIVAQLWDMKTGLPTFALKGQDDKPFSTAAFSPDSNLVVTRSEEGDLSLWDPTTGALQRILKAGKRSSQIAFAPNHLLYSCGPDGKIKRWRTDTGQLLTEKFADDFDVRGLAVSPDGTLVATVDEDKIIRILSAKTGAVIKTMSVPGASKVIMFSGDGKTLAWRSETRSFRHLLWDAATWKPLAGPPGSGPGTDSAGTPSGLALHPKRKMVATTWSDGTLRMTEFVPGQTRTQIFRMEPSGKVTDRHLAFTADGKYLAVSHYNGAVSLLRVPDELPDVGPVIPKDLPEKETPAPVPLVKDPSGLTFVLEREPGNKRTPGAKIGPDRLVAVDRKGQRLFEIKNLNAPTDFQVLPGERVLIAEAVGRRVTERDFGGNILWDVANLPGHLCNVQRLANGNTFIALHGSKGVLMEVDRAGKTVGKFEVAVDGPILVGARKLDNGKMIYLLSSGLGASACVWMDTTGKEIKRFIIPETKGPRSGLAQGGGPGDSYAGNIDVTPEGHLVFVAQQENKIVEFDTDGKLVWQVKYAQALAVHATRLPNGNTLATSLDRTENAVVELDKEGKIVWHYQPAGGFGAVRARPLSIGSGDPK
jgi:serine/threonine protein kinase/DNA-binding beta-propeller fold protein YncE